MIRYNSLRSNMRPVIGTYVNDVTQMFCTRDKTLYSFQTKSLRGYEWMSLKMGKGKRSPWDSVVMMPSGKLEKQAFHLEDYQYAVDNHVHILDARKHTVAERAKLAKVKP